MGKCVKVALIDDGISTNEFNSIYVKSSIEIKNGNIISNQIDIPVNKNHGSICASIIHKCSRYAQIYSIKILNSDTLKSGMFNLICALNWCLYNDIKVINMSLGSTDIKDFYMIKKWVDILTSNGIIIISALSNGYEYTYPASLDNVIGVCSYKGNKVHRIKRVKKSILGVDYKVNIGNVSIPEENIDVLEDCNSFAAPFVTGRVCNYLARGKSGKIKRMLSASKYRIIHRKSIQFSIIKTPYVYKRKCILKSNILIIVFYGSFEILEELNFIFWRDNFFSVICFDGYNDKNMNYNIIVKVSESVKCDLVFAWNVPLDYADIIIKCDSEKYIIVFGKISKQVKNVEDVYKEILKMTL